MINNAGREEINQESQKCRTPSLNAPYKSFMDLESKGRSCTP